MALVPFGAPVVNFTSATTGQLLAQVRAESRSDSPVNGLIGTNTSLTVPFPGTTDVFGGSVPGLSAGPVNVSVYNQTGDNSWSFIGTISLTVTDTRVTVSSIARNPINLASPPASFSVSGRGFANFGFGLPVVNFMRDGQLLAQARAGSSTGSTLDVPFPGTTNIFGGSVPGLSYGSVTVQVYNQTGADSWSFVGSTTLTVNDTRVAQVRIINKLCINTDQGCVSFTAKLTASEGYAWTATSGDYSPYQSVAPPTLSNFTLEAVEYAVSETYPASFNITAGRRYLIFITVDVNENLLLIPYEEGGTIVTSQELVSSYRAIR